MRLGVDLEDSEAEADTILDFNLISSIPLTFYLLLCLISLFSPFV